MDMVVGGERRSTLASELDQLLAMARELEAHVDRDSAAARELCTALASSVDKAIRIARSCSCPPEPAVGNAGKNAQFKKRKGMSPVRSQVKVRSVQDMAPLDDGLSWRKYGQKDILGAKYPRAYFRCTHRHTQSCHATKQVQRADGDPLLFDVVYHGAHTCAQAAPAQLDGGGANRPPSLVGAEQRPAAGQEQSSPLAVETEGIQWFEPMTPFSFPSSPVGAIDGCYQGCQLSSSYSYATGAGGLGVDMDFDAQFDELFWNPSEFSQPEIQNQ